MVGLAALVLAALACGGSFSTAGIADAWMSTDTDGANRTTVFAQDAVFYAQVDLQNARMTRRSKPCGSRSMPRARTRIL